MGDSGPSDAVTVSVMNRSVSWVPMVPLKSQARPPVVAPRTLPTSDTSRASPPKLG